MPRNLRRLSVEQRRALERDKKRRHRKNRFYRGLSSTGKPIDATTQPVCSCLGVLNYICPEHRFRVAPYQREVLKYPDVRLFPG
jgi:hypothetical protein